ncbi:MAG: hypothetical protein ACM30I_07850 [Gemmatimonas sp.]
MEHKPLEELERIAKVSTSTAQPKMSRRERLERWAAVLEQHGNRRLKSLMRVEFLTEEERRPLRDDNTPLSIALADPVLREQGLGSDCYGDAVGFFELNRDEAHYLLCDCHYHGSMTASDVAGRVQCVARRFSVREFWGRVWGAA